MPASLKLWSEHKGPTLTATPMSLPTISVRPKPTGSERVIRYSSISGQQALAAYAYDQALGNFENGIASH